MSSRRKSIPSDSLLQLRQRLERLPPKSPERAIQIATVAQLYGFLPPRFIALSTAHSAPVRPTGGIMVARG